MYLRQIVVRLVFLADVHSVALIIYRQVEQVDQGGEYVDDGEERPWRWGIAAAGKMKIERNADNRVSQGLPVIWFFSCPAFAVVAENDYTPFPGVQALEERN